MEFYLSLFTCTMKVEIAFILVATEGFGFWKLYSMSLVHNFLSIIWIFFGFNLKVSD